jgi:hypothetical protein
MLYVQYNTLDNSQAYIQEKFNLSSERMLHKDYDRKGSVTKNISPLEPKGVWRQDALIDGKPTVVE